MITNNGVEILSKYLVGQASSYASYIAVGSGARPTSNSQPIQVTTTQGLALGTVSGTGPYTSVLTMTGSGANDYWSYLKVGDIITATPSTGSLGSGTVTVTSINSPKQIGISSTATMTSGIGITNVKVYSSLTSQSLLDKASLDFETARFPITSRSYVVEKQVITPSSLSIISPTAVTVTIASGHPFGIGDNVYVTGVLIPITGPTAYVEVNGLYTITAISSTNFTATIYDPTQPTGWDSSMYSTPYVGQTYNNNLFFATAFTKQVSLTAEMSDTSRYNISELGVFSLGSNQYSTSGSSRMLLTFEDTEDWQYYNGTSFTTITQNTSINFPIAAPFFASSSNAHWNGTYESLRREGPKVFEQGLIVPGSLSDWTGIVSTTGVIGTVSGAGPYTATITGMTSTTGLAAGQIITASAGTGNFGSGIMSVVSVVSATSITVSSTLTFAAGTVTNIIGTTPPIPAFTAGSEYLRLSSPGVNLSKSSGSDEIRLAYSIMNAVTAPTALPTALYITFEFTCLNGLDNAELTFYDRGTTVIYPNRYNVLTKKVSDIIVSSGFDWDKVTSVKVYCALEVAAGTSTDDYAIVLDGLRFENTGTENPLYALTAYTLVNNPTASEVVKVSNSNDLINFRMDLAVGK